MELAPRARPTPSRANPKAAREPGRCVCRRGEGERDGRLKSSRAPNPQSRQPQGRAREARRAARPRARVGALDYRTKYVCETERERDCSGLQSLAVSGSASSRLPPHVDDVPRGPGRPVPKLRVEAREAAVHEEAAAVRVAVQLYATQMTLFSLEVHAGGVLRGLLLLQVDRGDGYALKHLLDTRRDLVLPHRSARPCHSQ